MKSKGRRLSVQEKVESKRSGVPRLRVLFALFAALLVIGVAVGCGDDEAGATARPAARVDAEHHGGATRPSRATRRSAPASTTTPSTSAAKAGAARQQQGADHDRLGEPAGRPDRRRPGRHQGRRARGQVPQREARRHRRSPGQAVNLLHLDVRGAGPDLRPEDGQQQGRQGRRRRRGRHRRAVAGRHDRRREADGLRRRDRRGRLEEQERLRASSATASGSRGRSPRTRATCSRPRRPRSSGRSCPASTRARRRSSMAPRSWAWRSSASAWNPNATDLVGPLTAAGAQTADVIILNSDPKGCVNLAKAIESAGDRHAGRVGAAVPEPAGLQGARRRPEVDVRHRVDPGQRHGGPDGAGLRQAHQGDGRPRSSTRRTSGSRSRSARCSPSSSG